MATYSSRSGTSWVPSIVFSLLVIAAATVMHLAQDGKIEELNTRVSELVNAQEPAAEPEEQKPSLSGSVADAIVLLPRPRDFREGRAISDTIYWVRATDETEEQLWVVDVVEKKTDKVRVWTEGAVGGTILQTDSGKYVRITYAYGPAGAGFKSNLFINKESGEVALTTESQTETPKVTLAYGEKTLAVQFDPADGCTTAKSVAGKPKKASITGLRADATVAPFDKPQEVACVGTDANQYPMFGDPVLTDISGQPVVRLPLPWGGAAIIPLPIAYPTKITYLK